MHKSKGSPPFDCLFVLFAFGVFVLTSFCLLVCVLSLSPFVFVRCFCLRFLLLLGVYVFVLAVVLVYFICYIVIIASL